MVPKRQNEWSHSVHVLPWFVCPLVSMVGPPWCDLPLSSVMSDTSVWETPYWVRPFFGQRGHLGHLPLLCSYKWMAVLVCVCLLTHWFCTAAWEVHCDGQPLSQGGSEILLLAEVSQAGLRTGSLFSAYPQSHLFQNTHLTDWSNFPLFQSGGHDRPISVPKIKSH